jgi:Flp pilus assembly pilin Flp
MQRFREGLAVAFVWRRAGIWRSDEGQDLLEYGLLMALIAVIAIGAVASLGDTINTVFWQTIAGNF